MQSLWMLFATFMFAAMGVCVKLASDLYSTSEIVMYRGIIGTLLLYFLVRINGGTLKTALPWQHAWRGIVGVTALWMWFYSVGVLPLAMSMTLNYTAPIWIAAFLFILGLRRRQTRFEWRLAAAILASFAGILLLLRPTIHDGQLAGGIIALISGMLSALAYLQVRRLGHMGEPEYRVVFYFSLTGVLGGLLGSLLSSLLQPDAQAPLWHAHTAKGIVLLLGIGILAAIAQMAMTRAYRLGNALLTANLQYTGIVFSSLWGIAIWGDALNLLGWMGIGMIVFSGVAATFYNVRNTARAQTRTEAAPDAIASEV
ncbi:DMT family transporter [Oxalobacteraceae bacterium R-40]|uniref:DMT family transporter n=1 Tax=Keguizhuia sedimenti TaxID=3064264 RepID=A0ABU1BIU9_9BURK|nr:DMT family transporter [Oxalobacteraceae bacterium R-40]